MGFGAWVLAAVLILAVIAGAGVAADPSGGRRLLRLIAVGVPVTLLAALPTWVNLSKSLNVAQSIAVTGAPGNLATPLKATQVFGVWLWESYKHPPAGSDLAITVVLIAITVIAVLLGALRIVRRRDYSLLGWVALTLVAWGAITAYSTTWVDAKTLMLTTPVVVLVAWGGVAALRGSRLRLAAPVFALVLFVGVIASDAMQYHVSDLAPTARYEELESIDHRFAGRGPTLFTDFDEYSMYALRDLDVGGPNFIYGPPVFNGTSALYRYPVELDRLPPASLRSYPLIVTRRDPALARPPASYRLLWQGTYYQVWGRKPGAARSIAVVPLSGPPAAQCARIERVARLARQHGGRLVAAASPELVRVVLPRTAHPRSWGRVRKGLQLSTPGELSATFEIPRAGVWDVWLEGQIMPTVSLSVDGHELASIGAQLGGNSVVLNPMTPVPVALSAGRHRLTLSRGGFTLAPGDGGSDYLYGLFLVPAGNAGLQPLRSASASRWRSLCRRSSEWIEAVG